MVISGTHPSESLSAVYGREVQIGHPCLYDALRLATLTYQINPIKSYLEVGVNDGASMLTVLEHAPINYLVLSDLWEPIGGGAGRGSHAHIDALLTKRNYKGFLQYLDGDSHKLLPTLGPSTMFDLITVDGDHSLEGATADLNDVWPHLRVGGILVFDDFTREPLHALWNRFFAAHPLKLLFEIRDVADGTVVARRTE